MALSPRSGPAALLSRRGGRGPPQRAPKPLSELPRPPDRVKAWSEAGLDAIRSRGGCPPDKRDRSYRQNLCGPALAGRRRWRQVEQAQRVAAEDVPASL